MAGQRAQREEGKASQWAARAHRPAPAKLRRLAWQLPPAAAACRHACLVAASVCGPSLPASHSALPRRKCWPSASPSSPAAAAAWKLLGVRSWSSTFESRVVS